jgi:lantibiotic biosynthesis protein
VPGQCSAKAASNSFVLRTPTLPWETIEGWSEGLCAPSVSSDYEALEAALESDAALLRTRLREIVSQPIVRAALYIGSPSLYSRLESRLSGSVSGEAQRAEAAIVRYVMRMAGRPTPYGLFAASTVGAVREQTCLHVPEAANQWQHSRLDFDILLNAAERISSDPVLQPYLPYDICEEAFLRGGQLRSIEGRRKGHARAYDLVETEWSAPLAEVFAYVALNPGASGHDIASHLVGVVNELDHGAALLFVAQLADAGLLRTKLRPLTTGQDALVGLAGALERVPATRSTSLTLLAARDDLARIDGAGRADDPKAYMAIATGLRELTGGQPIAFHVDLYGRSRLLSIAKATVDTVVEGVELLRRIGSSHPSQNSRVALWFAARFGEARVPLLEVLDEASELPTGILGGQSASSPLLDGLRLSEDRPSPRAWTPREGALLDRLHAVWKCGSRDLVLSDDLIAELSDGTNNHRQSSWSAIISLVRVHAGDSSARDRIFIKGVFNRTSGALLGRFCLGNPEIERLIRATIEHEEELEPNVIHAEIAYLPHGRGGNVVCRPILRSYEIDLFGASGAPPKQRIPAADLLVSCSDGTLRLWSRRLGRRVVPHLTCAHAASRADPTIYRFLASLADHAGLPNSFSWGALKMAPFLPRVTRGLLILAAARWNFTPARVPGLRSIQRRERYRAIQQMRAQSELPRHVFFVDGDRTLPVDLDNVLSVESFLSIAAHQDVLTLTEMLPASSSEMAASNASGHFHNELIIPMQRTGEARTCAGGPRAHEISPIERDSVTAAKGSWFYAKIYGRLTDLDRLLADLIEPLVDGLKRRCAIDSWHFLRYADPDWHLRLRLRAGRTNSLDELAAHVLSDTRKVHPLAPKITLDNYQPEIARYGGRAGLEIAEEIFTADSDAALALIVADRHDYDLRWQLTLLGMDQLLDAFGISLVEKEQLVATWVNDDLSRKKPAILNRQIGLKYRILRPTLETLFAAGNYRLATAKQPLERRAATLRRCAAELRRLETEKCLSRPLIKIARSFLHLWTIRMLPDAQNDQELVLCSLLHRRYRSLIARPR